MPAAQEVATLMKIIVFATTKGETGKTTLTYNEAIEAVKKHQVLIADLDAQRYGDIGELLNPCLVSNIWAGARHKAPD
jgi:hypothetical protein